MTTTVRSLVTIRIADLQRLAAIARADREDLFRRKPALGRLYADRLIAVALMSGSCASLHRRPKRSEGFLGVLPLSPETPVPLSP
jgi:hypothetical protein